MNGCTINIADFRCRAIPGNSLSPSRRSRGFQGFEIVRLEALSPERESDILQDALVQEDPTVYDIGIAREVQRLRHRAVFRPICIQRKAKVLRFRNEALVPMKMRMEERRVAKPWSSRPDGPCDLPPAA